jgi:hypothetical protein
MSIGYWEVLSTIVADGTALTAGTRASLLAGPAKAGLYTLPPNKLRVGDVIHLKAGGRLSTAVTTPGTSRWDIAIGAAALGAASFDSLALSGNIVVQTNVPWVLDVEGTVRVIGNAGNIFWQGTITSSAFILTAALATGPYDATITVPFNTAPVISANIDFSVANIIDFAFTQSTATASCTLHTYCLSLKTSTGF